MTIQYYKIGKTGKPAYKTAGLTDANCRQSVELQAAAYADYMLANNLQTATVWRTSDYQNSDNYKFRAALYSTLYMRVTGVSGDHYPLNMLRNELRALGYMFNQYREDDNGGSVVTDGPLA